MCGLIRSLDRGSELENGDLEDDVEDDVCGLHSPDRGGSDLEAGSRAVVGDYPGRTKPRAPEGRKLSPVRSSAAAESTSSRRRRLPLVSTTPEKEVDDGSSAGLGAEEVGWGGHAEEVSQGGRRPPRQGRRRGEARQRPRALRRRIYEVGDGSSDGRWGRERGTASWRLE